jgi:hypothetical protein
MGQNEFVIKGQVIDKDTKTPLPYATIAYQAKSLGTISNIDGYFSLSLFNASESDSIIISYVGYEPIRTIISECIQNKISMLKPYLNEISEFDVNAKKFKIKTYMKEVITDYNTNRRSEPHIAVAHYREKAKLNGKFIMYLESIGYSIFASRQKNKKIISNYSFFFENTKCHVVNPHWMKYKENRYHKNGFRDENVLIASRSLSDVILNVENRGLLSPIDYKKYDYKIDSIYYVSSRPVFRIAFSRKEEQGLIHIFAEDKQIKKIEWTSNKMWNFAFNKLVLAEINLAFNYFGDTPFISSIESRYEQEGLEHFSSVQTLVQKFNNFDVNWDEYWGLQGYQFNPYIEYSPDKWEAYNITRDIDYMKIEKDLTYSDVSLEKQFINFSGRWFFTNIKRYEVGRTKVKELIRNF